MKFFPLSSLRPTIAAYLVLLLIPAPLSAQQPNTDFQITSIVPDLVTTPEYSINYGPKNKKVAKNKDFVELEVTFDWQPRSKSPEPFLDELTVNYYVLLNNKSKEYPKGTLLVGSVTHTAVPVAKGLHSVMYISPRTLERFFDGKAPGTAGAAIVDLGVTISKQGQLVAEKSWKGKGQWWSSLQQVNGYVLNKSETPFAPLAWDYYEAIKARPAGF